MTPTITADQREKPTTPRKRYQAETSTRANGETVSLTDTANISGPTVVCTSENGTAAKPWAKAVSAGQAARPTRAISRTATWTAKALTSTRPETCTEDRG